MRSFPRAPSKAATRTSALLSLACTLIALANLPADELPLPWLLAFVLPGAVLALACRKVRGLQARTALGIVLQLPALWLAFELVGPLSRPIALACTILPPLGFATVRNHEADRALALFLGFCVLLVGVILGGLHVPLIAAYTAAACLALRCASHLAATASGRPTGGQAPPWRRGLLGGSVTAIAGCLFTVFVVERTIAWLPSPSRERQAQAPAAAGRNGVERRAGLADSFDLDGGGGVLGPLAGDRLVRVRRPDDGAVPADLYLRSGFFAVAGLDRWQLGPIEPTTPSRSDGHVLRQPLPGEALHVLEVERFGAARQYVFVPPGTCELGRLKGLAVDPVREWIRQRDSAGDPGDAPYRVLHHDLPPPGPDARLDPRARRLGLLELPAKLDRGAIGALLDEWRVGTDALPAMTSIALGLARHCRYERKEPSGPHAHAIENFLFAGGDHAGYCMHFASAAALLLRARGIPCRIAVGVFGGAPDPDRPAARVYGSQHAHAWVEVPFEGRGWVVFDPTPPAERGHRAPQRFEPIGDEPIFGEQAVPEASDPWQTAQDVATQPWALLGLLALLFAASTWSRRAVRPEPKAHAPVARTARRLLARLLRALAAAGHPRPHGQTLEAFAGDLRRQSRLLPEVAAALSAYQQIRFGGRPFDDEREAALRTGVASALAMRAEITNG